MTEYKLGDTLPIRMPQRGSTPPLIDMVDGDTVVLQYSYDGGRCSLSTTKQFIETRYKIKIQD